jgi:hypothetical protein
VPKEIEARFKKLLAPAELFAVINWRDDETATRKLNNLTFVLCFSQVATGFVTVVDALGGRHMQLPPGVKWRVKP